MAGWSSGTWGESGWGMSVYASDLAETATSTDAVSSKQTFVSAVAETGTSADAVTA